MVGGWYPTLVEAIGDVLVKLCVRWDALYRRDVRKWSHGARYHADGLAQGKAVYAFPGCN